MAAILFSNHSIQKSIWGGGRLEMVQCMCIDQSFCNGTPLSRTAGYRRLLVISMNLYSYSRRLFVISMNLYSYNSYASYKQPVCLPSMLTLPIGGQQTIRYHQSIPAKGTSWFNGDCTRGSSHHGGIDNRCLMVTVDLDVATPCPIAHNYVYELFFQTGRYIFGSHITMLIIN